MIAVNLFKLSPPKHENRLGVGGGSFFRFDQCFLSSGRDIWIDGEEGEGGLHPRADAVVSGQEGLHPLQYHQQENQHQVL